MARIQNTQYNNLVKDLYTNNYPYQTDPAQYESNTNSFEVSTNYPTTQAETYRGSVTVPAAMRPAGNYSLLHSKYIQVGKYEQERLDKKLEDYDQILRDIYGRTPSQLEALTDGRSQETLTYLGDNAGPIGQTGIDSLDRVAQILNDRTETVDDRITDLRAFKIVNVTGSSNAVTDLTAASGTPHADTNGDTLYLSPENIWIKFAATDKPNPVGNSELTNKIQIAHLVRAITDDSGTTDFNTASVDETFVVHTFTYDEAGHIRSKHAHTYTMPKNFKYITVTSNPVLTDIESTTTGTCTADNLTDTLTYEVGNKWICLTLSDTENNDKIIFKHYLKAFAATTGSTDFNSANVAETFDVNTFSYDEAGHVTAYHTHTYTMPKNFKYVATANNGYATTTDLTSSSNTLEADILTDTITYDTGNKWIKLAIDTTNDKITIGHLVQSITETTSSHSFDSTGNTFDVPTLTYDEAGHIRTKDVCTYTLPNSIKGFRVGPSDANDTINAFSDSDSGMANLAGLYTAGTPRDIMVFTTGNKWIHISNPGAAQIKIAHNVIHNADIENIGTSAASTPTFGGDFNVPYLSIDKAGHVTALTHNTVTIPTPSLTDGTGNVMTSLALTASTGAFTVTKANVGTLALTDYSAPSVPTGLTAHSSIAATDSLNVAIAALQSYAYANQAAIEDEVSDRAQAINDLVGTATTFTTLGAVESALVNDVIAAASTAPTTGNLAQWVSATQITDSGYSISSVITDAITELLSNVNFTFTLKTATTVSWDDTGDVLTATIDSTDPNKDLAGQTLRIVDNADPTTALTAPINIVPGTTYKAQIQRRYCNQTTAWIDLTPTYVAPSL